jgi:peptide-methionine (S)-S-oxide reductase
MKTAVLAFSACIVLAIFTWPSGKAGAQGSKDFPDFLVVAGGCFWCVESDFEKLDGVGDVLSGYSGGAKKNPTYRDHEGHLEVAKIPYNSSVITYRELVDYFFRHIDPLDDGGQFCDRGHAYTTAVFYRNDDERAAAEASKVEAEAELGETVVTPIREFEKFWIAEDYHQDYYKKNPLRYKFYRTSCGRDRRVNAVWSK